MSYIRAKEIPRGSGNWYDYEVMGIREGKHVRQKVIRYIGKSGTTNGFSGGHVENIASMPAVEHGPSAPIENHARITSMKIPASKIASAMGMYYGGMSLDGLQQQFKQDHNLDMSESNYWNWVTTFTKKAINEAKDFHPTVGDHWTADETYLSLGKRNVYFWDIIDDDSRYLLATHVSFTRGKKDAQKLMELAEERAGKAPKTITTDKLASYIQGVEIAYGTDSEHRQGGPFDTENNTNRIERFHRTLQQRTDAMAKFKNLEDIRLLTNGWLINYNFMKQNTAIGDIPPAQAMSKVVPFKDWNDIIKPEDVPDVDYKVTLYPRRTAKKLPVVDAILKPIEPEKPAEPRKEVRLRERY